ncbi:MAG: hypothetical protein A2806_04330 [Candidatus Terrybacteria bacterium RIFCSPHIGHO2_01_FULL_48_17]|uniref:Xylose isomerase-like TIM barrel domain-containing protein n=1 Tax=Candidatus Terrybacteria bacterium RIFCSPHIGHO2_01_FULL_48_17 TaxID=1802362 RepID=A0A1G2PKU1_9BACT|nr:MAG: hypothetical protein A2806_04330 [Candidatus Terrybacteria bacterium RIFCSPHIGHO2_01_FULL_48_17]
MRLAFKVNAFANRPDVLVHAAHTIKDAGFSGIGLVFDKPFLWLPNLKADRIRQLRKLLQETGLSVESVSTCTASGYWRPDDDFTPAGQRFGPSFTSRNSKERELRVRHTIKVIDFAQAVGCRYVDTSTGYQPQDMDVATTWKYTRDCLRQICDYAEKRCVSVNIEYEPGEFGPGGLFVGDASTAMLMIADVGSPALGVNLDVGHSYVCGEDVPATIRMLGERVRVVELDDIASRRDEKGVMRRRHYHLVPGEGEIEYRPIFEALREINFQGPVIVELYSLFDKNPEDACKKTFGYLAANYGSFFK